MAQIANLNQVLRYYMFYQSEGLPLNRTKHNKVKKVLGRLLIFSEGKYSGDHKVRACEKSTFVLEKTQNSKKFQ